MNKKSSDELIKDLIAALEREPLIDLHHWPVHAHIEKGQVILEGKLENIAAKKTAGAIARRVAGEQPVLDLLRVRPAQHQEDDELKQEVANALLKEPVFERCTIQLEEGDSLMSLREMPGEEDGRIRINAHDGVVTLAGQVWSLSHSRLAEVLVWWTAGCEAVENRLAVVPPEEDNDAEISDAVRIVLEKDPLVHADQIASRVENGVVTLEGYVASGAEKRLAVLDAWYIQGVQDVNDKIEARS